MDERIGTATNTQGINSFSNFINELQLVDLPLYGAKFTWGSNRERPSHSRLDRFWVSTEVLLSFPDVKQKAKPKSLSDHNPILLMVENLNWGPTPFKFFNYWLEIECFKEMIAKTWSDIDGNGNRGLYVYQRLRLLKPKIKEWYNEFGKADHRHIEALEDEIHSIELHM